MIEDLPGYLGTFKHNISQLRGVLKQALIPARSLHVPAALVLDLAFVLAQDIILESVGIRRHLAKAAVILGA